MPDICCISLLRDSLETMQPYGVILGSVVVHGMFDSYAKGLAVYFKWERVCKLIWHVKQFSAPSHSYCANKVKFHQLDLLINQVVNKSQHVVDTHCSSHLQESECRPHGEPALSCDYKHLIHLHVVICHWRSPLTRRMTTALIIPPLTWGLGNAVCSGPVNTAWIGPKKHAV